MPADILKNHGIHPVLLGKWEKLPCFPYLCPNKCFLHHKYAKKGFYKAFALQRSFVVILWINEVGGTCKMNIEMALKSRSYILDLDRVKLSLGIFFFLSCLMESFFHQLLGYAFMFVKNTHQKAANLLFGLILPAGMIPAWFLGWQHTQMTRLIDSHLIYFVCIHKLCLVLRVVV